MRENPIPVSIVRRLLSPSARSVVKRWVLVRRLLNSLKARQYAVSTKRLDLCVAGLAQAFYSSGVTTVEGKDCLEIGSGWVLTHSLGLHILGAESVTSVDIERIANFRALRTAVRKAQPGPIVDYLTPFSSHSAVRERLETVRSIRRFNRDRLNQLGLKYLAPLDLAHGALPSASYDFVYSTSVLEHVPVDDVTAVLETLASSLRSGGKMVHVIHLEDHRDFDHNPWAFLSAPSAEWDRIKQTECGNRFCTPPCGLRHFRRLPD